MMYGLPADRFTFAASAKLFPRDLDELVVALLRPRC